MIKKPHSYDVVTDYTKKDGYPVIVQNILEEEARKKRKKKSIDILR